MSEGKEVHIQKRDGQWEAFDQRKLAAAMWRAMPIASGRYIDVCDLAAAIEIYLARKDRQGITSRAVFEMTLKVLRRAGFCEAAEAMEEFALTRGMRRRGLAVVHEDGRRTCWNKTWLVEKVRTSWNLSRPVSRIIAGQVEQEVLRCARQQVQRGDLLVLLNRRVAQFGLADAVPVRQ
jgi:transcriptional regulator NrdR family protein